MNQLELTTKEIFPNDRDELYTGNALSFLNYLAGASDTIGPWWSTSRDLELKSLVKNSDHLGGVVGALVDAISTIPVDILPIDPDNQAQDAQGEEFTNILLYNSISRSNPSGIGYKAMIKPAIADYYSTDNGLFIAIDGPGNPDGPIMGMPTRLIHLDSTKCTRTSSVEYPVIYYENGRGYKLHQSRVIAMSANPDSDYNMNGVGFCSVSRAINTVQHLIDIGRYEQEKLGSRPLRGIMHIQGGGQREVKALDNLLMKYNAYMDNEGFTRYGKIPIFGSQGELSLIDFASLPDGYDKLTSTQLAMAQLALAFGVSTRFLAFAIGVTGTTRADAQVQEDSMKIKGIATFVSDFSAQLNLKFLPDTLYTNYDYQDDDQDRNAAEIRKIRAEGREKDLASGVTTIDIERQLMVQNGELTRQQVESIEDDIEEEPDTTGIEPVRLNGIQVRSLRETLRDIKDGSLSRENGIEVIMSLGIPRENAEFMATNALGEKQPEQIIDDEVIEVEDKAKKKYSSTQFEMPVWVTRLASEIASTISQEDIEETEFNTHITLKYGLTHSDVLKVSEALSTFDDITLEFGELSLFENDSDVLKIDIVKSPELEAMYNAVAATGSDDLYNGEFNPHLTIAYLKKGTGWRYTGQSPLTGKTVTIDSLTFSNPDRTIAIIPLGQRVKSLSTFTASLRSTARGLSQSNIDLFDFISGFNSAIERGYNQAWIEGAESCGISPDDRTQEEQSALNFSIADAKSYVFNLGDWIIESSPDWPMIATRLDLWSNRYNEVYNKAKVMACANQKLEWILGDTQHCLTCSKLSGRVARASRWQELDIWPRDTRPGKLQCRGFNCECELINTTKPVTRGRWPSI